MELITHLQVTDFPWLQNWTISLWQDTIIEWKYWSGKTSVLKSISFLLTWKDLQWNAIPWITNTTRVTSRWAFDMTRTLDNVNINSLNWLFRWEPKDILARIVPWFLLSWALTNTSVVESLIWINYKWYDIWYWSINKLEDNIKEIESYRKLVSSFSNCFQELIKIYKNFWIKWIPISIDDLLDYLEVWMLNPSNLNTSPDSKEAAVIIVNNFIDNISHEWFKNKIKDYFTWLRELSPEWYLRDIKQYYRDYTRNSSDIYSLINNIISKHSWEKFNKSEPTFSLEAFKDSARKVFFAVLNKNLEIDKLKQNLANTKNSFIQRANDALSHVWIKVSWNFQLSITIKDWLNDVPLLALPRHKRFLYEVSLCSRAQDIILNYQWWALRDSTRKTWIILIDDYMFDNDDDSIDKILTESLDHQVIITRTDNTKELTITH